MGRSGAGALSSCFEKQSSINPKDRHGVALGSSPWGEHSSTLSMSGG